MHRLASSDATWHRDWKWKYITIIDISEHFDRTIL